MTQQSFSFIVYTPETGSSDSSSPTLELTIDGELHRLDLSQPQITALRATLDDYAAAKNTWAAGQVSARFDTVTSKYAALKRAVVAKDSDIETIGAAARELMEEVSAIVAVCPVAVDGSTAEG